MFIGMYVLCLSEFFGLKDYSIVKSPVFKTTLTVMNGLDGFSAAIIGVGMYYKSLPMLLLGLILITKFGLLHLLNRMILAHKKGEVSGVADGLMQTSKSFLHHVASFLFLSQPHEIILTAAWRTISMSGHALLVFRGRVPADTLQQVSHGLAYLRQSFLIFLLSVLACSPSIRQEFAVSAVGHIAYMMVRVGPVFSQGGAHLTASEKEEWGVITDGEKIGELMRGKHITLGVELLLLFVTIVVLAWLRGQLLLNDLVDLYQQHRLQQQQEEISDAASVAAQPFHNFFAPVV